MKKIIQYLFETETKPVRGLLLLEWVMLGYTLFTLVLMGIHCGVLVDPQPMLLLRVVAVLMVVLLWLVYRRWPMRFTMMLRIAGQLMLLGKWYPDTYELNRIYPNLDHVFASLEQFFFGCQPALTLHEQWSSPVVSELLSLGYVSYFPMIATVAMYYFCKRYDQFLRISFIILASFFLFYIIFIFLPVAGPQYYYEAVGTDQIAQGVLPDVGHYFLDHQKPLPIPGVEGGVCHHLLVLTHDAGERPTAAFPSSHVGIATVLMWLAWRARSRWLFFCLLPLAVLLFFATFYIQAHYVIDAIAGLFVGTAMFFLFDWVYRKVRGENGEVRSVS